LAWPTALDFSRASAARSCTRCGLEGRAPGQSVAVVEKPGAKMSRKISRSVNSAFAATKPFSTAFARIRFRFKPWPSS
jgi:hypothetical protein